MRELPLFASVMDIIQQARDLLETLFVQNPSLASNILIYRSRNSSALPESDIFDVLHRSQEPNARHGNESHMSVVIGDIDPRTPSVALATLDKWRDAHKEDKCSQCWTIRGFCGDVLKAECAFLLFKYSFIFSFGAISSLPRMVKSYKSIYPLDFKTEDEKNRYIRLSYGYLNRKLKNLTSSLNNDGGQALFVIEVFNADSIQDVLLYKLVNEAYSCAMTAVSEELSNSICEPFMLLRSGRTEDKIKKIIRGCSGVEILELQFRYLPCKHYQNYIKTLQKEKDGHRFANQLVATFAAPFAHQMRRSDLLDGTQRLDLSLEFTACLRQLLVETIHYSNDHRLNVERQFLFLRVKRTSSD